MITPELAQQIAEDWVNSWNTRNLDAIMTHYADTIEFWSPLIIKRLGIPNGKITDKAQLRSYFAQGLEAAPELHFTLLQVFPGVDSITIHYRRQNGLESAEMMVLDEATHQATMARVHYNAPP